jgi:PAS domain S-box-containing protein
VTHVGLAFKDVTEETQYREAAETERDRLRLIVEQSGDGIVVVDEEGVVRLVNPEAQRQYGVSLQEVPPAQWTEAYALETLDGHPLPSDETALYRALHGRPQANARWQVRHADGSRHVLTGTASPLRRPDGSPAGAVLTVRDETARLELQARERKARAEAEHAAAILDAFIEAAPIHLAVVDEQLRYVRVNRALAEVNGYSVEEHIGRTIFEVIPSAVHIVAPLVRQVFETGQSLLGFQGAAVPPANSGALRHYVLNLFPLELPGREGRLVGVAVLDVTEQHDAREVVENQQRWLTSVLNRMPTPVLMLEPGTGAYLFVNQAAQELFERMLLPNESGELNFEAIVVTDTNGRPLGPEELLSSRVARGEELQAEEMIWSTPGGAFNLLFSARQLPAIHGHGATIIASIQDVTHLKAIERDLKHAVRARDQFLSIASHELKTPLTSMKLHLQSLRRNIELGREEALQRNRLHHFGIQSEKQVDRLNRLVDDMLDISRLATGKLAIHRERFELTTLVQDVIEHLRPQIDQARCSIALNVSTQIEGEWDRFRLEQVLINLLTNAARYGAGKPIEVDVGRTDEWARISVRDYGRGIAPEDHARIFQQFERAVSERDISGLGLGLFIARQIVTMHGGSISVESTLGEGAVFTVLVPSRLAVH